MDCFTRRGRTATPPQPKTACETAHVLRWFSAACSWGSCSEVNQVRSDASQELRLAPAGRPAAAGYALPGTEKIKSKI